MTSKNKIHVAVKNYELWTARTSKATTIRGHNVYQMDGELKATFVNYPPLANRLTLNFSALHDHQKSLATKKKDENGHPIFGEIEAIKTNTNDNNQTYRASIRDVRFAYYGSRNDFVLGFIHLDVLTYSEPFILSLKDAMEVHKTPKGLTAEEDETDDDDDDESEITPSKKRRAETEEEPIKPFKAHSTLLARFEHQTSYIVENIPEILTIIETISPGKIISMADLQKKLTKFESIVKTESSDAIIKEAQKIMASIIQD
jgi:hypothetical protein